MKCFLDLCNSKIKLGFMNSHSDLDVYYFNSKILLKSASYNLHRIESNNIIASCPQTKLGDDIITKKCIMKPNLVLHRLYNYF